MEKESNSKIESAALPKIKGFIETSFVDWRGKIASVIFLPNCNFRCPYCHNPDMVLCPETMETLEISDIMNRLDRFKGWVDGVCITGGEPTLHTGLPALIRYIKQSGAFLVKIDTNGTNPDMLGRLISGKFLDAVSMDVKAPLDDIRYYKAAGVNVDLEKIKKSIDILKNSGLDVEFRTTVHPRLFREKDIIDLAEQLSGASRLKLQNFNRHAPTIDDSYQGSEPFNEEEFARLQALADRIIHGK